MRPARLAIALSIATAGCSGSTPRVNDPASHAARSRMDTVSGTESAATWNLAPLGTLGWETFPREYRNRVIGVPIPADYSSDDTDRWFLGSFRARLRNDHVEWAPQLVAGGIAATTNVGGTEMFVTRGGTLARSADWLGPLERTSSANTRMALEYSSRVRTLTLDDDLNFWSGGADDGMRRVPAPSGTTWIDLAFLSDRVGYGIAEPGRIYRTTDGGAHWTRFEPHTSIGPAFRVVRNLAVLRVDGLDGSFEVEEDGQDRAVGDRTRRPASREAERILRDWLTNHPLARPTLTALQLGFELQHHTLVTIYGETLYEIRPDGRQEISMAPNTTVREGEPGCRVAPLGGRIAAICPRQDGISVAFERAAGDWQTAHQFAHDRALEVATSVTPTMTFTGPCNDATALDETFCWTDGSRWITRRRRGATVVAHPGDHGALLHDESRRFPEWSWVSVDGADERAHELKFTPRDATVTYAETAPADGITIVASHQGARLAGIGNPTGIVELRPLPTGARSARFASGMRGIAVGDSLRDVWLTEDAGVSWRRAALPFEGDGHEVDLETDSRPDDVDVRCWARGCVVGRALLWAEGIPAGIRAVGDLRGSFLGPQSLVADELHHPFDFHAACEFGPARTQPEPAPIAEHASPRGFGADGAAQIVAGGSDPSSTGSTRVVWRGVDARGAFESSTAVSSWMPSPFAAPHDIEQQILLPRLAERDVLVAVRCDGSHDQSGCDSVVYAHAGRPAVFVNMVQLLALDRGDEGMPTLRGTLREPDGSIVIHIAFEDRLDIARDVVMRIDASDHITTIGRTTWDVRRPQRVLARWNGRVGLAVFRREDRERIEFHPFDGDPGVVARAWTSGSHVRPCAPNERAEQADTFELSTNALAFRGQVVLPPAGHDVQGLPTIRLLGTPGGDVCLRDLAWAASFAVSAADEEQAPRWFRVHVGSDGAMRGPVVTRDGLRDGMCRITTYE